MYSMRSREYDVTGAASTSPPHSMPSPTVHTEWSGANSPSVFTWKHVSVKAGKGNVHHKNRGRRSIFVAQDDNVTCLLCSIVQKGTHKCNIKRHYDTVLCRKSTSDAANLSIFTLYHVHCGLRCVTSSWGHIEYMIADACCRWFTDKAIGSKTILHIGGQGTLWKWLPQFD